MTARRPLIPLLVVVLASSVPRPTGACLLAVRYGHWQKSSDTTDTRGPTNVSATFSVQRPAESSGCAGCGTPAYLVLDVTAIDDTTPRERIGFKLAIVDGQPPQNLEHQRIYTVDTTSVSGTEIGLDFDRDAGAFSFDVEITAVDASGNESTPIVLEIDG